MGYKIREMTIDDVCTVVDCLHKTAPSVDSPTKYRMLRTSNIRDGKLRNIEDTKSVTKETYDNWSVRGYLEPQDVILTREAPMGEVAMIDGDEGYNFFLGQRLLQLKANKEVITPEFLYFSLQTNYLKHQISMNEGTGSVVSNIRIPLLKKMRILVPPISIQKKISNVLSNFDDKTKANQKIIANLEELSQTLFKRWFIDFEFPDEDGNPFKTSGGKLVSSELGDIPAGWEVKQLKSLAHHKKDTFNPNKTKEEQIYHFSLPAYDSGEIPVIEQVSEIKSNKWFIDKNCVLFSKMNPRTMRVWLTDVEEEKMNVCSTEFVVLESDSSSQNSFIYNVCKSDNFAYFLQSNATGSTNSRQRIRPNVALDYKLAINTDVMEKLATLLEPYTNKMIALRNEISILASLRDTILPKLMSGEIELSEDLEVEAHAKLLQ